MVAKSDTFQPACKPSHTLPHTGRTMRAIEQDYEPKPAMWRLADEDTTITIFGTFHILPEGFRWRTPLFDSVMTEADEVVFESRDEEEDPDAPLSVEDLRFMTLMMKYRPAVPLSQRIAERNRPKLARMLDLAGIAAEDVDFAPPLITMFAIADATAEAEGSMREFGVETVIEAEFKASGRPISAIEDPVAVMGKLLAIDESHMIAMIDEGLDEWDGCALTEPEGTGWETEHNWARGALGDDAVTEMLEDPFGKAFYEVLLVDRNSAWTDWLSDRLTRPGNLLLAVGAGHMEGPDSVIVMLERKGLKAERIQ